MRRRFALLFIFAAFLFLSSLPVISQEATPTPVPKPKKEKPTVSTAKAKQVADVLAKDQLKGAKVSIKVLNLKTGKLYYEKNPTQLVIPASTNKIVSGSAAMDTLGPQFQFRTQVYYDGQLSADGSLAGNLYIKGFGDPDLSLEQAWLLAHMIRGHGIKKIDGFLIGDDSYFDGTLHYPDWGKVGTRAYHAPMGALSVNFNTVGVFAAPGPKAGDTGVAILDPPNALYKVDNFLKTVSSGRTRVGMTFGKDNTCVISGQIRTGTKGQFFFRSINDPLPFALSTIRSFLAQEGVTVTKGYKGGNVPETARLLYTHRSRNLSGIIATLYRHSNNFTAEQTARTLGATQLGAPATQDKAAAAITDWLQDKGLSQDGVVVKDASGLSRGNRTSAAVLTNILKYMWNKPEVAPEFVNAMAIGGVDGTLKNRFRGTPLHGRVRAKSGLLWGVITLAGYCYDKDGAPYAFAVLVNDYAKDATARDIQRHTEAILNILMK